MLDLARPHTEPLGQIQAHARTYHRFLVLVRFAVLAHVAGAAFFGLALLMDSSWLTASLATAAVLLASLWLERRVDSAGRSPQAEPWDRKFQLTPPQGIAQRDHGDRARAHSGTLERSTVSVVRPARRASSGIDSPKASRRRRHASGARATTPGRQVGCASDRSRAGVIRAGGMAGSGLRPRRAITS